MRPLCHDEAQSPRCQTVYLFRVFVSRVSDAGGSRGVLLLYSGKYEVVRGLREMKRLYDAKSRQGEKDGSKSAVVRNFALEDQSDQRVVCVS